MRTADARSWQIERPAGVASSLQVSEYKVEPRPSSLARNLLSNDDSRSTGGDESEPLGPEVEITGESAATSGAGEVLAGTRSGPDAGVIGPSGVAQDATPGSDAGEEVTLPISGNVGGLEVSDRSFIDDSWREVSSLDQIAGPLRDVRIHVVEKSSRQRFLENELAAADAQEARHRPVVAHVDREVTRHHGLGRTRSRGKPRPRSRGDLTGLEGARRDLAKNFSDDVERTHAAASMRRRIPSTTRPVSIGAPAITWSLHVRSRTEHRSECPSAGLTAKIAS